MGLHLLINFILVIHLALNELVKAGVVFNPLIDLLLEYLVGLHALDDRVFRVTHLGFIGRVHSLELVLL